MYPKRSLKLREKHYTIYTTLLSSCRDVVCGGIELYYDVHTMCFLCVIFILGRYAFSGMKTMQPTLVVHLTKFRSASLCFSCRMNEWTHVDLLFHSEFNAASRVSQQCAVYINSVKSLSTTIVRSLSAVPLLFLSRIGRCSHRWQSCQQCKLLWIHPVVYRLFDHFLKSRVLRSHFRRMKYAVLQTRTGRSLHLFSPKQI